MVEPADAVSQPIVQPAHTVPELLPVEASTVTKHVIHTPPRDDCFPPQGEQASPQVRCDVDAHGNPFPQADVVRPFVKMAAHHPLSAEFQLLVETLLVWNFRGDVE